MAVRLEQEHAWEVSETHQVATRGVGLAVVNLEGNVWVHRDNKSKPHTGRRVGELSIPFETAKPGEPLLLNVLGALPEIVSDHSLAMLDAHLYTTDRLRSTGRLSFGSEMKPIEYSLAVTIFDGDPKTYFSDPYDSDEAVPFGWMKPEDFLSYPQVRPLARHAVEHLHTNGIFDQKLAEFYNTSHERELIVPRGFIVSEFYRARERVQDMQPGREYAPVLFLP